MRIQSIIFLVLILTIIILDIFKYPSVVYLPFRIPGKQMAITIPPFGMFIEKQFRDEDRSDPCTVYRHEMEHWKQYKRMGLTSFYYNYLKVYFKYGRFNNWMEREARRPCIKHRRK